MIEDHAKEIATMEEKATQLSSEVRSRRNHFEEHAATIRYLEDEHGNAIAKWNTERENFHSRITTQGDGPRPPLVAFMNSEMS